ncbi:MAG: caspase family protein [Saprospiraceae bacterium]
MTNPPKKISFILALFFPLLLAAQGEIQPVVQFGHPGYVIQQIILSPDNEIMATTDGEFLKLWDMSSQLELRSFRGDNSRLGEIVFSANGDTISYTSGRYRYNRSVLTGEISSRIDLVKKAEEERKRRLEEEKEQKDQKKGKRTPIIIFNKPAEKVEESGEKYVHTIFSQDGTLKALIEENTLTVIEEKNDRKVQEIKIGADQDQKVETSKIMGLFRKDKNESTSDFDYLFQDIRFSPDNQSILVDTTLYDITTGKVKFQFSPHKFKIRVNSLFFQPNSSNLIFCGEVLNVQEQEERKEENVEQANELEKLYHILKQSYQVNLALGNTVIFANTTTGKISSEGNLASVNTSNFTRDQRYLITGHLDKSVYLWDLKTHTKRLEIKLRPAEDHEAINIFGITHIVQTNDDKYLIVACAGSVPQDRLTLWDIETGRKVNSFGAAIPPISLEVRPSLSDSIIVQEYKEYLFPFEQLNYKEYGAYRLLNLRNGKAPALYPKFDSITFSPKLDYYLVQANEFQPIKIYGSEYNEFTAELKNSQQSFEVVAFSNNAKWVAAYNGRSIYIWNTQDGSLAYTLPQGKWKMLQLVFSPNDDYLISTYDPKRIYFYSMDNPSEIYYEKKPDMLEQTNDGIKDVTTQLEDWTTKENGQKIWAFDINGHPISPLSNSSFARWDNRITNARKATELFDLLVFREYYDIEISPDGKYAAAWRDDLASVQFIDLENKKNITLVQDNAVQLTSAAAAIWLSQSQDKESVQQFIQTYLRDRLAFREFTAISPLWDRMAIATKSNKENGLLISVVPIGEKQGWVQRLKNKEIEGTYRLEASGDYAEGIIFSPDGQLIAASSNSLNSIRIWNANDGSILKTLEGHSGKIAFTSNSKTLISSGWDRQVKVWDINTEKELYSFIAIKGENDYVNIIPTGYYNASRKNSGAIAFAYGKDAYPFDQFDIQFNRPDLLLKEFENSIALGKNEAPNNVLIDAYYRSYLKRLEKLKLSENTFREYVSLPKLVVAEHPLSQNIRQLTIQVQAEDKQYRLNNLFATINGVPVLDGGNRDISGNASRKYAGNISFDLSEGENLLQVYVVNENGTASLKYNTTITYTGPLAKKTLHIVTLGTSIFANNQYNLDFATKDLVDFRTLYRQRSAGFDDIVEHRLEGQDFTLAKFRVLKNKLSQAKPDDEVICFISTHGLLDGKLDYYLATYDVNFQKPSERGLSYSEVENFLLRIGARKKLVFMDACHSGELDSKDIEAIRKAQEIPGAIEFSTKGVRSTGWEQLPGQQSFDLMKELFVDLRVGTGATIIASASAVQFAYEGEEWENSAFTYCLLRALKEKVADLNNNDAITVSEIQQYLAYAVSKMTYNGQRPINRVENIFNNYVIW